MKKIQLSLAEVALLVAVAAAACNLWIRLAPHWGTICAMARDATDMLPR